MATSLNALTLKINADTEGVSKAVRAVRGDVNRINRIMGQTASATDKARQAQDSLNRVYKTGAISGKDYLRGMEAIRKKYGDVDQKATRFQKTTEKIKRSLSGSMGAVLGFAAGMASIGTAITAVTSSFSSIDLLAKTSDKLGLATEKLAALRFAANETGVASNTLDMALQRMVRRVSEAANGTGEAQGALKELGLDAQQLSKLAPDEQFKAISEAMAGVNNQSDQVRLAFKLFDSEGVNLVNTLKLGRDGLNSYEQAARDLGIAVDREAAAKIEKANDAFARMKLAVSGVANEVSVALAPAVSMVSQVLTPVVRITGKWGVAMAAVTAAVAGVILIAGKMARAIADIRTAIDMWRNSQIALLAVSGPKGWAILAGAVVATGGAIYAFNSTLEEQNAALTANIDKQTEATTAMLKYQQAANSGPVVPDAGRKTTNERVQQELDRLRERRRLLEIGEKAYRHEQLIKDGITSTEELNLRYLREKVAELEKQRELEERIKQAKIDQLQERRQRVLSAVRQSQKMPEKQTVRVEIPPSITKGSREEYQKLVEQQNKARKDRIEQLVLMRKQKAAQDKANQIAEAARRELEAIRDELASLQGGTAV